MRIYSLHKGRIIAQTSEQLQLCVKAYCLVLSWSSMASKDLYDNSSGYGEMQCLPGCSKRPPENIIAFPFIETMHRHQFRCFSEVYSLWKALYSPSSVVEDDLMSVGYGWRNRPLVLGRGSGRADPTTSTHAVDASKHPAAQRSSAIKLS